MTDFDPHQLQFYTENVHFQNNLSIFRAENTRKSKAFKEQKNNALTLPMQLQNNFQIVENTTFWKPRMVKNDFAKRSEKIKFGRKISTSEVIYGILELKLHP